MSILTSNPTTVAQPDGQFSQVVKVSAGTDLLFISGQVPRNLAGQTIGVGDITAQAEQVFGCLQSILSAHGTSFSNAIKATIFVTDISLADEVVAVRAKFYGSAAPASTFVAVAALGHPDWLLEVELIAAA
jgi:enamine deaminase RidA (YjgF/YER057c/UK114 family)